MCCFHENVPLSTVNVIKPKSTLPEHRLAPNLLPAPCNAGVVMAIQSGPPQKL
jgi:hypothetical protein